MNPASREGFEKPELSPRRIPPAQAEGEGMRIFTRITTMGALAGMLLAQSPVETLAASHREAPLTAVDRTADITDFYAFVSYDKPE
jgi:hypothetical protein